MLEKNRDSEVHVEKVEQRPRLPALPSGWNGSG